MTRFFYDGQCPLCSREIRTLRKLQGGNLMFVDIHEQTGTNTAALPTGRPRPDCCE
ncbi:DCC1-like thiol-disulfide oxidoreductase family protein [Marinobacter apostichopi]|uniref:DCC1-like thiol-disulfide oxidoreductase family protein n=1 Tax=Marinobacter apostichopi TaxID=3035454 RepID=UPI002572C070|nr:DCC1-like thiol-disulfide oxidoreductase family protein [Marinobacter sp. LA51]